MLALITFAHPAHRYVPVSVRHCSHTSRIQWGRRRMVDATLFTGQPPNSDPVARPEAIIRGDRWRISILTDSLVRFEWSDAASSSTNERKASSTVISESLRHTLFAVMPMAGSILRPNGYVSFMMEARSLPRLGGKCQGFAVTTQHLALRRRSECQSGRHCANPRPD